MLRWVGKQPTRFSVFLSRPVCTTLSPNHRAWLGLSSITRRSASPKHLHIQPKASAILGLQTSPTKSRLQEQPSVHDTACTTLDALARQVPALQMIAGVIVVVELYSRIGTSRRALYRRLHRQHAPPATRIPTVDRNHNATRVAIKLATQRRTHGRSRGSSRTNPCRWCRRASRSRSDRRTPPDPRRRSHRRKHR